MDTSYEGEEATPLISRPGIPTAVQDNRRPHQKQLAEYIILASTLLERIAFYTLAANLAFNLESEKARLGPLDPSTTSFIFSGTSYISTIIFAVISDWKLGRAKSIILGFLIYLVGYVSATFITAPHVSNCTRYILSNTELTMTNKEAQTTCYIEIIIPLTLISIGAGAVQSNMAVFGAEQTQKESKITSRYFDKYVIVMNISGIIAVLVIRAIFNKENGSEGMDNYTYPATIAACMVLVAALLFLVGWRYYIHVTPFDTVVNNCIPVYKNAFQTWRRYKQSKHTVDKGQLNSVASDPIGASDSLSEDEEHTTIVERPSKFLDFAKAAYHGKFNDRIVDDVKSLGKACFVFALLIPYWLVYHQLNSTFSIQARYMKYNQVADLDNAYRDTKVAIVWLGDPVTIIVGILILNMFVYKYLDARNRSLTITTKFMIGMFFAFMTMNIAGIVEVFRQIGCQSPYGNSQSNLTILYQLPQNILMGFSEMFAMVASFEYAYYAAPRSAQTLFMSLRFCSLGISSFIATGYMVAFSTANSNRNTKFHMDFSCQRSSDSYWSFFTYFFTLGGIQLIFMIIFIICQRKFTIIKWNPQKMARNQFIQQISSSPSNTH